MSDREPTSSELSPLRDDDGRSIVGASLVDRMCVIAEAVFANEEGPPPKQRVDWLGLELEDYLAHSGGRTRFVLWLSVLVIWILAPLLAGRLTSLARMRHSERVYALGHMESGFAGAPVLAVKALLCVLYYEHPDAAREIGFDGLCLTEAQARRLTP